MKIILYVFVLILFSACTKKSRTTDQQTPDQLVQRGKSIYNLNCIACHNSDPNKEGTAGPPIYGSNKELLEARILRAAYPAGH